VAVKTAKYGTTVMSVAAPGGVAASEHINMSRKCSEEGSLQSNVVGRSGCRHSASVKAMVRHKVEVTTEKHGVGCRGNSRGNRVLEECKPRGRSRARPVGVDQGEVMATPTQVQGLQAAIINRNMRVHCQASTRTSQDNNTTVA
jgi:hypothetical protein